jgi:hypothetical protein
MEEAIASCPDLFIEPGLSLMRRQIVINGRRPDLLFCDAFSRDLLVEIQSGRLDGPSATALLLLLRLSCKVSFKASATDVHRKPFSATA